MKLRDIWRIVSAPKTGPVTKARHGWALVSFAFSAVMGVGGVQAQASLDADTTYKPKVNACLASEDYSCALDAIVAHGRGSGTPGVVVSLRQGPTLLGAQMFAVLDLAQGKIPDQDFFDMTQVALNYVLDAQPTSAIASGPFVLLAGEACLALEDWACVRTASQPLQILMSSNQFYIKGGSEGSDKPDINTRVINLIQEYNKRTR